MQNKSEEKKPKQLHDFINRPHGDEKKKQFGLTKAHEIGYLRNQNLQAQALKKHGYILDRELSNERENVIAYNPHQKKLIHIINGTELGMTRGTFKDLWSDLNLVAGTLKNTDRYQSEKNALTKAREKYNVDDRKVIVTGHSLGGALTNYITPSGASGYTHNAGFTVGQKARENVLHTRSGLDIVSALAPKTNTTTFVERNPVAYVPILGQLSAGHTSTTSENIPIYF